MGQTPNNASPIPKTYAKALEGLRDPGFLTLPKWQEQQWKANKDGAHVRLVGGWEWTENVREDGTQIWREHRGFVPVFIRRMQQLGVPMYAHCIVRTEAEQQKLFDAGKSKDSPADGIWPHKAWAADIVHSTKHWDMTPMQWKLIGHIGKEVAHSLQVKVTWGGDWSFYDPAHWELADWRERV